MTTSTNEHAEPVSAVAARSRRSPVALLTAQPRFTAWSLPRRLWESIGGALITGVLGGLAIQVNVWLYLLVVAVSFLGGAPTGAQHRTLWGAELRALVGGTVWAAGVFLTRALMGGTPVIPLPETVVGFLPWGFVPSCVVATVIWTIAWFGRRTS